jgi:hypothetical protein
MSQRTNSWQTSAKGDDSQNDCIFGLNNPQRTVTGQCALQMSEKHCPINCEPLDDRILDDFAMIDSYTLDLRFLSMEKSLMRFTDLLFHLAISEDDCRDCTNRLGT